MTTTNPTSMPLAGNTAPHGGPRSKTMTTTTTTTTTDPRTITAATHCPQCGADVGYPCVTAKGNPAKSLHKSRLELYETVAKADAAEAAGLAVSTPDPEFAAAVAAPAAPTYTPEELAQGELARTAVLWCKPETTRDALADMAVQVRQADPTFGKGIVTKSGTGVYAATSAGQLRDALTAWAADKIDRPAARSALLRAEARGSSVGASFDADMDAAKPKAAKAAKAAGPKPISLYHVLGSMLRRPQGATVQEMIDAATTVRGHTHSAGSLMTYVSNMRNGTNGAKGDKKQTAAAWTLKREGSGADARYFGTPGKVYRLTSDEGMTKADGLLVEAGITVR